MVTFVDAFAGIGGFHYGIKAAAQLLGIDVNCVAAIENDTKAADVYNKNHHIQPLGDITKIPPEGIPDHDILVGGFPCQPFSKNGKFYNKNNKTLGCDARIDLADSLINILHVKQPKVFVFENVKELLSIKTAEGGSFADELIAKLQNANYTVVHCLLSPQDFGIPQQRKRVFFVGIRKDISDQFVFPLKTHTPCCVGDILEDSVAGKYYLIEAWRNRRNRVGGRARYDTIMDIYHNGIIRPDGFVTTWDKPDHVVNYICPVAILYDDTPSGLPRQQDKIYSTNGISPTIATFSTPAFMTNLGPRILTPRECYRLQSFPESFVPHTNDAVAYKHAGNSVNTTVVSQIFQSLLPIIKNT